MPFTLGVVSVVIGISILTTNILIYNKMSNIHNKDYRKQCRDELWKDEELREWKRKKNHVSRIGNRQFIM